MYVLEKLGDKAPYSKTVDARLRFLCPTCGEVQAQINPRNNLAHCFGCGMNLNSIDLLRLSGYRFVEAVAILQEWLRLYRSQKTRPPPPAPVQRRDAQPVSIGDLLRQEFGNQSSHSE